LGAHAGATASAAAVVVPAGDELGAGLRARALGPVRRTWPSVIAGLTVIAVTLLMAFDSGGYFAPSYLRAGAIAWIVLAVLLVLRPPHFVITTRALIAVGTLAGLAVWMGISTSWSSDAYTGLADTQRTIAYAGLFALGLIAAGSGRLASRLAWAVLTVIVAICAVGLLSRLYPDVVAPDTSNSQFGNRLSYPLEYWNALGALAAMGIVLAAGLAADKRARTILRAAAAGTSLILATTVYLTLSRGAVLALAVGLLVLLGLARNRISMLGTIAVCGGGIALTLVLLGAHPALISDTSTVAQQRTAGHRVGPILLLLVVAVAVTQAGTAYVTSRIASAASLARGALRRLGLALGGLAVVVALAGYLVDAGSIDSFVTKRSNSVQSFVSRQWNDFLTPSAVTQTGTARLTTAHGTRSDLYRVALDAFAAHPLVGDGAGSFGVRWMRMRRFPEEVRNAHSLYLETLADLGLVGGLLLLGFIATMITGVVAMRRRPGGLNRAQLAAVSAALAVWLAHSAVDWDFQVPALWTCGLLLAATTFPHGRVALAGRRAKAG
jgi:O-antigen ligase